MTREDAKEYLKGQLPHYLRTTGRSDRKPFRCISPDHFDKTPSMSYYKDKQNVNCFGCGVTYDIFDAIGIDENLSEYADQFAYACKLYGVDVDNQAATHPVKKTVKEEIKAPEVSYKKEIEEWQRNLSLTDYHLKRGITPEVAERFRLGFCPEWKHPKAQSMTPSPRLIIPTSDYSYTARYTGSDDYIDYKGNKQNKSKAGAVHIFNGEALKDCESMVFCCEGEIDAMSLEVCGAVGVAYGSAAYVRLFEEYVKNNRPKSTVVIVPDNDEAGRMAAEKVERALLEIGITCKIANICGDYKDINARLVADREGLQAEIDKIKAEKDLEEEAEQLQKEQEIIQYMESNNAASSIDGLLEYINKTKTEQITDTGFPALDEMLGGGLRPGLYVVGALSSLGKTTFTLQIADHIAKGGRDVLFFSLEMARYELMSKSISRESATVSVDKYRNTRSAKTVLGIMDGRRWENYSTEDTNVLMEAMDVYREYAQHLFIHEGVGNISADRIRELVASHITLTGNRPVVIVDYLQILAAKDVRMSDKQNTDYTVVEMKRISRDYGVPVICISSFNRESYTEPVSMSSFKESGAVEYTSDVLIGLQYAGMDYQGGETEKTHKARVRNLLNEQTEIARAKELKPQEVEIKVLKNRSGNRGTVAAYFFPRFNYFSNCKGIATSDGFVPGETDTPFTSKRK